MNNLAPNDTLHIQHFLLSEDSRFPNNPSLPLLLYPQAVTLTGPDPAAIFERLFQSHQWGGGWRNGIFSFHHYHSTAHEVLGIYSGEAEVQFGGEDGIKTVVQAGDVVLIPAGVAHKKLRSSAGFAVVGAYPVGQRADICTGEPGERPQADHAVARVARPAADPVFGATAGLCHYWP